MLLSSFVSGEFEPSWHNFHIIEENVKHAGISHIVFLPLPSYRTSVGLVNLCWCNGRCVQCLLVPARRQGSTDACEARCQTCP